MTTPVIEQTLTGCLYGRNSAAEEKSIEDQLAEGVEDAESEGIRIVATYDDGVSASWYSKAKSRDGWANVLDDITNHRWDVLILWEPSRGDRSPDTWSAMIRRCADKGILIRIIRDETTFDPRKPGHLEYLLRAGVDSATESAKLKARVQKGIRGSMKRGTPLGRAPLGYTHIKDARSKVIGQEVNEHADIVRRIFSAVVKGVALGEVARRLNADRIVTNAGRPWTSANVRDTVRCRQYVAERRDADGEWVKGNWPAIIDDREFFAVQAIFDGRKLTDGQRKVRVQRPGSAKYLLSSIARCGVCGGVLKYSLRRRQYMCAAAGHVAIRALELDEFVTETVIATLSTPDIYASLRRAGEDADLEVARARDEVARLEAKLSEAKAAWLDDRLSTSTLTELEGKLKPRIDAARERAERAGVHPVVRGLVSPGEDVAARWAAMPLAGHRDVIRALMTVTLHKPPPKGGYDIEDRVTIVPA